MQMMPYEEVVEKYGLSDQDIVELQLESLKVSTKTLQMVEASLDDKECKNDSERLQFAKGIIEMSRTFMEHKFAELVSNDMPSENYN